MALVAVDWGFVWGDETIRPIYRKHRKIGELVHRDGDPWRVSWWRGNELDRREVEYRCRLANVDCEVAQPCNSRQLSIAAVQNNTSFEAAKPASPPMDAENPAQPKPSGATI